MRNNKRGAGRNSIWKWMHRRRRMKNDLYAIVASSKKILLAEKGFGTFDTAQCGASLNRRVDFCKEKKLRIRSEYIVHLI
jgi:hypothetical protein